MRLRASGMTFGEIAQALGYKNSSGAYKAYRRGLNRVGMEKATEALMLQYERYNEMLYELWPGVQAGDLSSIRRALDVMDRIDRLFGLDRPTTTAGSYGKAFKDAVLVVLSTEPAGGGRSTTPTTGRPPQKT